MISDTDKAQLMKIRNQIDRLNPSPEIGVIMTGGLNTAFYIGYVSALQFASEKSTELAEANARDVAGGNHSWANGYVEGGNHLLEALIEEIERLNRILEDAANLASVRHPQD